MSNISLIILDVDGTLYDMADLSEDGFNITVDYLVDYQGYKKEDAIKELNDNHIYPYVAEDAKSTTGFFMSKGFDIDEWDKYRSGRFNFNLIKKENAIKKTHIEKMKEYAKIVLVTNNTMFNVKAVLNSIGLTQDMFNEIICNQGKDKKADKTYMMKKVQEKYHVNPKNILSIGDRFDVDGKPAVSLGYQTIIIKNPKSFTKLIEDFNSFKTCLEYTYYD